MGVTSGGLHGGARRSARIERQAEEILALVRATPNITLAEIADHLFKSHGDRFVPSVIWRFFDRRNVTFKKTSHASKGGCTINRGLGRAIAYALAAFTNQEYLNFFAAAGYDRA